MAIEGEIKNIGDAVTYTYSGSIQEFIVPVTGLYKLEVWGGDCQAPPASPGGYSYGHILLEKGKTLYVVVGGRGIAGSSAGGYNGGGSGFGDRIYGGDAVPASGGGATHIATMPGTLYELRNATPNRDAEVLIVAGGAGGSGTAAWNYNGEPSYGGGTGNSVGGANLKGRGQDGAAIQNTAAGERDSCAGGGGGWLGGKATRGGGSPMSHGPAYGGSGYIDGVPEITFHDIVYKSETISGNVRPTPKNNANWEYHGRAVITLVDAEQGFTSLYLGDKPVSELYLGEKEVTDLFIGNISLK